MKAESWNPDWLQTHCTELSMVGAWRGVETQYIAASMKLVDTMEEYDFLEQMLEESKPPAVPSATPKHFLLLSPFRYFPQHSSRFRPGHQSGLWYGSSTLPGACSEIAYWRMRFILDSAGLASGSAVVTEHTFYQATVQGQAINLMGAPWVDFSHLWKHLSDYSGTHKLAEAAINAGVQWIQYESVRAPSCSLAAVLTPDALVGDSAEIEGSKQEWICKASRDAVLMRSKDGVTQFEWHE